MATRGLYKSKAVEHSAQVPVGVIPGQSIGKYQPMKR